MFKHKILIVDDEFINREILKSILENDYSLIEACNGQEAIDLYRANEEDLSLVLLDMMMPDKDGMTVIKELKQDKDLEVPVIFVTGKDDEEQEINCIKMGAVDYIKKPFHAEVIKARIAAQIVLKQNTNYLKTEIEKGVAERTKMIESIILALADMVEYRSMESGEHVKRVQSITKLIIRKLKETTNLLDGYTEEDLVYMTYAAALHDIGKVRIKDSILLKPDRFTPEEYDEMKKHTEYGEDMAKKLYIGENQKMLELCSEVCRNHHEKWDGTGYPDKLKETGIPISARIVAIADVFDALINKRVYKEGNSLEEAFETIKKDAGTYFDPQIVEVFLTLKKELYNMFEK